MPPATDVLIDLSCDVGSSVAGPEDHDPEHDQKRYCVHIYPVWGAQRRSDGFAVVFCGGSNYKIDMLSPQPIKDPPTVTAAGERLGTRIEGVEVRRAVTHTDERGTLCEILSPAWNVHPLPLVYVYQFTIRPGKVKGWHVHRLHDDRIFISRGEVKVVLYDSRVNSPTHGLVNEIFRTSLDRDLMVIPAGVYHAHQNCGAEDALFISMPTRPYNHDDPDVYRLPVNNDVIPYRFENSLGR